MSNRGRQEAEQELETLFDTSTEVTSCDDDDDDDDEDYYEEDNFEDEHYSDD